jgi:hypothetical protein
VNKFFQNKKPESKHNLLLYTLAEQHRHPSKKVGANCKNSVCKPFFNMTYGRIALCVVGLVGTAMLIWKLLSNRYSKLAETTAATGQLNAR